MGIPTKATSKRHNFRYDRLYVTNDGTVVRLNYEYENSGAEALVWFSALERGRQFSYGHAFTTDINGQGGWSYIAREATPEDILYNTLAAKLNNFRWLAQGELSLKNIPEARLTLGKVYLNVAKHIEEVMKREGLEVPELHSAQKATFEKIADKL